MSKQSASSSHNIWSPKEQIRKSSLATTLENLMQYPPPMPSSWESSSIHKHSRESASIGSKISSVEFDFQSDMSNKESPFSSYRSSLDENHHATIKPRGFDSSIESVRARCENQSDLKQYQLSNVRSASVGKVIDETIAAIEATNRELLSRAEAAEKSTRILREQNCDLQRTLERYTRLVPGPCSPPSANIGHRSRPSLNYPRSNSIIPPQQQQHHHHRNSLGHLSTYTGRPKDSFDSLDAELSASLSSRERYSDVNQSMQSFHLGPVTPSSSLNSPLPLLPISSPSTQHPNSSKNSFHQKGPIDNEKHASSHGSSNVQDTFQFPDSDHRPLSSNPLSNISSPLPGSVRYHSVVLDGNKFIDSNRPKLVSLEEARRRVKSTSTVPIKSTTYATPLNNNHLIEGESVSLRNEFTSPPQQQTGEEEMKSEKKKSRLQDLFTGRRKGSRDEKM